MTYNEWHDELKKNLLCVSEAEKRRVLDYYAEAYADRRDAGFSEREIIEDFGSPYDAAQKILYENTDDRNTDNNLGGAQKRRENNRSDYTNNYAYSQNYNQPNGGSGSYNQGNYSYNSNPQYGQPQYNTNQQYNQGAYSPPPYTPPAGQYKETKDYTWVFVLLCILFAIPIFMVVVGMVVVTTGLCVAPFALLISAVATIGAGVGEMFVDFASGGVTIGMGLIAFGVSLIIMPLFFKLVKIMWKLFTKFFSWLRGLFKAKRSAV